MIYEAVWEELEEERGSGAGHVLRRIHPESAIDLHLAVAKPSNRRVLILSVDDGAIGGVDELPAGRGIETRLHERPEVQKVQLELVLMDPSCRDIFSALAQDVAGAVAPSHDDHAAA